MELSNKKIEKINHLCEKISKKRDFLENIIY